MITDQVELKLQKKKLRKKMQTILKKREQLVLEMRYGLANNRIRTQREIAQLLGISRSYVSRIEKKAIMKLAKEMNTDQVISNDNISSME